MSHWMDLPEDTLAVLRAGAMIPAHLLALDARRQLDAQRQRALTRYYLDAGVDGLAVGVHSTQFAIREAGLYEPVLRLAMDTAEDWTPMGGRRPLCMVAGLAGPTEQAVKEARIASELGYHFGLLSLAALKEADESALIAHCEAVAEVMPLFGFYLQPAVGGVVLSPEFWRRFALIENVVAIKIAPFNRYRTLDVIQGLVAAHAEDRITLYTGNDDHFVLDLLTPYVLCRQEREVHVRIRGGLLGHWSVWTHEAVKLFRRLHAAVEAQTISPEWLALDARMTDINAALFDVAHDFRGCIAGCHEVLRRQGLLEGVWCLDPDEGLSPGQAEAISRVQHDYPELLTDDFIVQNREHWMS